MIIGMRTPVATAPMAKDRNMYGMNRIIFARMM